MERLRGKCLSQRTYGLHTFDQVLWLLLVDIGYLLCLVPTLTSGMNSFNYLAFKFPFPLFPSPQRYFLVVVFESSAKYAFPLCMVTLQYSKDICSFLRAKVEFHLGFSKCSWMEIGIPFSCSLYVLQSMRHAMLRPLMEQLYLWSFHVLPNTKHSWREAEKNKFALAVHYLWISCQCDHQGPQWLIVPKVLRRTTVI